MGQHKDLKIEELSRDELDNIHKSGNLRLCPRCLAPLGNTCVQGGNIVGISTLAFSANRVGYKACHDCKIVWKYSSEKWIDERGDGMVIGEGVFVYLTAFSDCFHARQLLKLFDGKNGFVVRGSKE